ncbi:MAG: methionine adenosyltransferase [Spirochaetota bacterium]|nr:methionine adenosyltransferase [Spirochaetota bacterium]
MTMKDFVFTSESVSEGHPDKVCDQISDAIVDAYLSKDPKSRIACETLVTTNLIIVSGEVTSTARIDCESIARKVVSDIGYNDPELGFDAKTCEVRLYIHPQSPDISQGVTSGEGLFKEQGAGDQGMMFGYSSDETDVLMPMPIIYSHRLVRRLAEVRRDKTLAFIRPDSKSQVTVQYENFRPVHIDTVVISTQHSPDASYEQIKDGVIEEVIKKVIPSKYMSNNTQIYVNPTGRFEIGGPNGDTGLTGRKIIVDTYGGWGRHGGGAFSGKDPSKVDRSATYMARYIAKNIIAAKLAQRCEVQLAYAIGVAEPVSIMVDTFGTGTIEEEKISKKVREVFGVKPTEIIEGLNLLRPIYLQTASYGHFGREEEDFTWERIDKANELK